MDNFREKVCEGIPAVIPAAKPYDSSINHAPRRKDILTLEEKKLALKNALRYLFSEIIHKSIL